MPDPLEGLDLEALLRDLDAVLRAAGVTPPVASSKPKTPRCGARRKRDGEPCQAAALRNGRCRFHGGLSAGPTTPAGKVRALGNLKQYRG